ncbi:ankyrin repeat and SOCS box protein 2-like, partial [Clarias magur]
MEDDELLSAVWDGDVKTVRNLLTCEQAPRNLLKTDANGWTAVHEASYYGQTECLKLLLSAVPEMINSRTSTHQTPVILAVFRGHLLCVEYLLEKGADPGIPTITKETPLYEACATRNIQMVHLLVRNGADANQKCLDGWTALHESVSQNDLEICEVLVEHGAEISPRNIYGVTPLFLAAQCGRLEPLRFFIKKGADVNSEAKDGATALYEACRSDHSDIVECLLAQSADTNRPGKDGLLPLHIAAKHGNERIISKLIPITSMTEIQRSGISPVHLSAESNEDGALELLIHSGFDVNFLLSPDRSCMYEDRRVSALYFAVENRKVEAARMLLDAGADPNLDPFNVLLLAVRQGHVRMVTLLLEHGANVNAGLPTHPSTFPACVVLSVRNIPMMKCLMDHGCDAEACFECEYGSEEHPTYTRSETETRPCLQFCEMISARPVRHCTGPVVNLLLDYVSHVTLCSRLSKLLESDDSWIHIKDRSRVSNTVFHPTVTSPAFNKPDMPDVLRVKPSKDEIQVTGSRLPMWTMAAPRVSTPSMTTSSVDTEDYSIYANMTEEQLLELAIEQSLADANTQQICSRTTRLTAQCSLPPRLQSIPPPANPPAHPPANPPAYPPANPPLILSSSNKQFSRINHDAQNHLFSKEKGEVIAWTRHNGFLRVTVESVKDLDPFLSAIWNGDAKALSAIIQTKSRSVLKTNQEGWLPLHDSAYYGHVDCLKILLSAQPETINRRTLKNQTPLLLAVSRRHSACVYYLLEKGADPNLANHQWETPLYKACEKGTEEAVGLLIRYGALTNKASIQGATPLHEAVASKNVEMCKLLLQAKAILMAKNIYGIDPTFTAAQCGAAEVLRFLLMKGADVNTQANDGASALFEASKNGHSEVVEILLANHAQVNKSNKAGLFPIHVAAKNGHYRVVSLLIPRTDRTKIKHCGISPLHLAAERNRDEVLEILIDAGFDVNSTLSEDWSKMYEDHRKTALYCAVSNSNVDAAAMLLEAGADPNLDTFNPLLVAVRKGCIEMVKLLVNHGANINSILPTHPTEFPAALIFSMNNLPMIKYLMDYGCDAQSCFKCDYGSGTHPPIKSSMRDGRDRLYYLNDESSESCVQFCEMIARPKVTNWAGPIIDILLDYVGHVKLCSRLIEHLDTYSEWAQIKEKA